MIYEQPESQSRSGGDITLVFKGDKAAILAKYQSYLHNTFYTGLGYFDRDGSSLTTAPGYDMCTLVFRESFSSTSGDRSDGDREYSFQDSAIEAPIEQNGGYKYCHNHNLYKCTASSAGSAPGFFATATDDSDGLLPPAEGVYRWGKSKPAETVPDGMKWVLVAARTKSFDMYRTNQTSVVVTTYYKSRRSAESHWTPAGVCETPPVKPSALSSNAQNWLVSGSTIDFDGTYWRLVRTYDYAKDGFDEDYY